MRLMFWRKPFPTMQIDVPETHKRVDACADRFNTSLMRYTEYRDACAREIEEKQEELRQIDAVITAMRAGLVTLMDDPAIQFTTKTSAENVLEYGSMPAALEREFAVAVLS